MSGNGAASRRGRLRLAAAVLAAALALAACGSDGGGSEAAIEITGTDALTYQPAALSTTAGTVTVQLTAEEGDEHTFVIEELDDAEVVAAGAGETATGTVDLEAGSYTFYCNVEGHRSAGMEGELTVTE